jgi:hypothetical protein
VYIRTLLFLAFSVVLLASPGWAATCGGSEATSCTNTLTDGDTRAVYEFGANGRLVVQFDNVLTTFVLTVTLNNTIDPLDPNEFPSGTVCVPYSPNGGQCVQYDFSGLSSGPNGVPVKNKDYKGLITLTLSYVTSTTTHIPAFGHAPGDNASATYTENILTSFSADPAFIDPTMGGKVPGLSSVAAFDEPLVNASNLCSLTVTATNNASDQKPQEEVLLKVASNCSGTGLRDKTASLSVSTIDTDGSIVFPPVRNVEGNKFHWDNKNGLNEYDISTDGLESGKTYTVTVFSSKFSPATATFVAP